MVYFTSMSTRTKKPKKIALTELGAMVEHIVNHMVTKDDLDALDAKLTAHIDGIDTRLVAVESKVDGINRRLDTGNDAHRPEIARACQGPRNRAVRCTKGAEVDLSCN